MIFPHATGCYLSEIRNLRTSFALWKSSIYIMVTAFSPEFKIEILPI